MTTTTFDSAKANRPAPTSPIAGGLVNVPFKRSIDASAEITAANDKLRVAVLPADHVPVDCFVSLGDLDGGTALVWDLGIEDTTQSPSDTTDLDCLIDGATVGQSAGVQRPNVGTFVDLAPVPYDRYFTILIDTPPGTDQDAVIKGSVTYRSVLRGL